MTKIQFFSYKISVLQTWLA